MRDDRTECDLRQILAMELLQVPAKRRIVESADVNIRIKKVHSSGQSRPSSKVIFEAPLAKQPFEPLIQFTLERRKVRSLVHGAIDGFSLRPGIP